MTTIIIYVKQKVETTFRKKKTFLRQAYQGRSSQLSINKRNYVRIHFSTFVLILLHNYNVFAIQ